MTLKSLSILSVMMATASSAFAYQQYPVKLQNPPETSKVTQTYDESTGIYKIHVDENAFGSEETRPTIRFEKNTEVLPEYAKTLAFEYKATKACSEQKFICYNMMTTGKFTRKFPFYTRMEISDEWQTYRIAVGDMRGKPNYYGDKVGQYQDLIFMDFVTGTDIQIRNIRYEDEEIPFIPITLTAGKATSIEAENFNLSAVTGLNYGMNPAPLANTPYIDPTPGLFPIYAFTSVNYVGVNVSDDFMENMKATAELLNKKYRDMEAAGFTITEGGAYPAIDRCFLFDGLTEFNGYQANLHDGIKNLKMIIRNGVDDSDVLRRAKSSDRLAGYVIKDEPFAHDMDGVKIKSDRVLGIDDTHLLYGNLININYP
ncbi:MAG: hypothetical protein K2M98_04045, partial [Muribaculum sp.]|nr:hypothetical protein [Muribaculum sp.]